MTVEFQSPKAPYFDHEHGQWVGEHERWEKGETRRDTQWFDTREEAAHFARYGEGFRTKPEPEPMPNIGDTCCGKCPGATCYVDQITGERG